LGCWNEDGETTSYRAGDEFVVSEDRAAWFLRRHEGRRPGIDLVEVICDGVCPKARLPG
jgi:hypothetical protein